jgi:hypothetical protein
MPFGMAARSLAMARRLDELPETAHALLAGDITPLHARVLTDACTTERAEALRSLEPHLLDAACRCTARQFRGVVRRVCDAIDGDNGAGTANELYERRHLYLSHAFEGMGVLNGELDPEGTEIVATAIETRMTDDPDAADEPKRSRHQRRADALVDICRLYLARHDDGTSTRRRGLPHLSAVLDLEMLSAAGHDAIVARVRGDLEHVGAVSAETLRRISCDAHISRVVTDGASQPLDVGRATRTVSLAMWRALVARDRHCTAAGCDRPPAWCEAHHVRHWADGGTTSLDNLELLCWRHHRRAHEGSTARAP